MICKVTSQQAREIAQSKWEINQTISQEEIKPSLLETIYMIPKLKHENSTERASLRNKINKKTKYIEQ